MALALLAATLLTTPQDVSDKAVYRDDRLGVSFEYPKAWQVRRERLFSTVVLPLDGGKTAQVQIFSAVFRQKAEEWQSVLKEVNTSMGRTVARQWQEEILGVPMLLTKVEYSDEGRATAALIGLLYSRTAEKFQFRLVAEQAVYDQAETQWREAMLTLRTVSGTLPPAEDPAQPVKVIEPPKRERVWARPEAKRGALRGPVRIAWKAEDGSYTLFLPAGWSSGADGTVVHPRLTGSVRVAVASGSAPAALERFNRSVLESLGQFQAVAVRSDAPPKAMRSGAEVATVLRRGTAAGSPLAVGHALGFCETCYWLAELRWTAAGAPTRAELRLLDELFDTLYVSPER